MPINNGWIKAGALVAALAVTLGALGEPWVILQDVSGHTNGTRLFAAANVPASTKNLNDFHLAVFFQLAHALALVAVGILMVIRPGKLLQLAGWVFLLGVVLFSGSIYLSVMTAAAWTLPLKMIGGGLLVVGWIVLVEGACPGWNKKTTEQD